MIIRYAEEDIVAMCLGAFQTPLGVIGDYASYGQNFMLLPK